jgi:multiple sugar transport system permease protein
MPPFRHHRPALAQRLALALAWLAVVALLAPLLVMALGALHAPGAPPPRGAELLRLPAEPGAALARAVALVPLGRALLYSTLLGLLAIPPVLLSASGAGLALALAGRRTRGWLAAGVLLVGMVPPAAVWVPRFLLFKEAGLVGTWAPVLAPALFGGSPLFVLLYAAAFRRLPPELFEAAQLEGVSAVSAWWRLALPQVRATSVAVALLAFALFFGNFVDPLLYLNPDTSPTAPMMLRELQLLGGTQWPVLMAGAVLVTAPTLLAFAGAQRTLVSPREEGS